MNTDELLKSTGETVEYARLYAQQKIDHTKLEVAKRVAITTSNIITQAIVGMLAFMVVIFLSLALGFFLAGILDSFALAFVIVALIYMIATAVVVYFKNPIITNPVLSAVLKNLLD